MLLRAFPNIEALFYAGREDYALVEGGGFQASGGPVRQIPWGSQRDSGGTARLREFTSSPIRMRRIPTA